MKRIVRLATASVVLAFASTAFAGPTNAPFVATFATQETLGLDLQCPSFIKGTTTGSGIASHLGATTGIGTDCITLPAPGGVTFHFSNGKLTLTAANGDQLTLTYDGSLAPTATLPIYAISGRFTITGGTGRFNNASGAGSLSGLENLVTNQGHLNLSGTISY